MTIGEIFVPMPYIIVFSVIVVLFLFLIILYFVKADKNVEVADPDTREEFGNFSGLLTKEDFEVRADDPMVEIYRTQWIMAEPGDQKDNYLLLYLALKQLNCEQDESEEEWTQEQCEARMDEIINELSEKTGIKLMAVEETDEEIEEYFNEEESDDNL